MNNQGLEALAALASSTAPAATNTNNNQGDVLSAGDSNASGPTIKTEKSATPTPTTLLQQSSTAGTESLGSTSGPTPVAGAPGNGLQQNIASLLQHPNQHIQQALLAAVGLGGGVVPQQATSNPSFVAPTPAAAAPTATPPNLALLAGIQQLNQGDPSTLVALQQQLNSYQYLTSANQQAAAAAAASAVAHPSQMGPAASMNPMQALTMALSGRPAPAGAPANGGLPSILEAANRILPTGTVNAASHMPPPSQAAAGSQAVSVSTAGVPSPVAKKSSARKGVLSGASSIASSHALDSSEDGVVDYASCNDPTDKKQQKRAANRRSAQLSRKRKKQFIEELKEENDGLRRKELILKSIPDMIVVFDSSGKLWFVSESVTRFLDFDSSELEGTSLWDRLCDNSVRKLKAAFMDSLAARQTESNTATLGPGLWELQLVDKDGTSKPVTLNGVVHFAGERPECVCTIRPLDVTSPHDNQKVPNAEQKTSKDSLNVVVSANEINFSSGNDSSASSHSRQHPIAETKNGELVRISDSANSSGCSDTVSSSGDEMDRNASALAAETDTM